MMRTLQLVMRYSTFLAAAVAYLWTVLWTLANVGSLPEPLQPGAVLGGLMALGLGLMLARSFWPSSAEGGNQGRPTPRRINLTVPWKGATKDKQSLKIPQATPGIMQLRYVSVLVVDDLHVFALMQLRRGVLRLTAAGISLEVPLWRVSISTTRNAVELGFSADESVLEPSGPGLMLVPGLPVTLELLLDNDPPLPPQPEQPTPPIHLQSAPWFASPDLRVSPRLPLTFCLELELEPLEVSPVMMRMAETFSLMNSDMLQRLLAGANPPDPSLAGVVDNVKGMAELMTKAQRPPRGPVAMTQPTPIPPLPSDSDGPSQAGAADEKSVGAV